MGWINTVFKFYYDLPCILDNILERISINIDFPDEIYPNIITVEWDYSVW